MGKNSFPKSLSRIHLRCFKAVSIEIVSSLSWSQGNFPPTTCVEFVRCLLHTLTDYVTSLLRYSENHNVLKGKYPKPLSLFSHTPEVMTHRILQREMYKTLIFPLAFGALILWPSGQRVSPFTLFGGLFSKSIFWRIIRPMNLKPS